MVAQTFLSVLLLLAQARMPDGTYFIRIEYFQGPEAAHS